MGVTPCHGEAEEEEKEEKEEEEEDAVCFTEATVSNISPPTQKNTSTTDRCTGVLAADCTLGVCCFISAVQLSPLPPITLTTSPPRPEDIATSMTSPPRPEDVKSPTGISCRSRCPSLTYSPIDIPHHDMDKCPYINSLNCTLCNLIIERSVRNSHI